MLSQIAQAKSDCLIVADNCTAECQKVTSDGVGIGFCRAAFGKESASLPLDETIDYFQAQAVLHRKVLAA